MDSVATLYSPTNAGSPLVTIAGRFKEYEAILARNSVGRIAFAVENRVTILPVQYAYSDGWIYGRTTLTPQTRRLLRNRRIAFEVDEHNPLLEWQSVVVRGPLYPIDAAMAAADSSLYARAISLIRRLLPSRRAPGPAEKSHEHLFRIRIVEISGRGSEPGRGTRATASKALHSGDE